MCAGPPRASSSSGDHLPPVRRSPVRSGCGGVPSGEGGTLGDVFELMYLCKARRRTTDASLALAEMAFPFTVVHQHPTNILKHCKRPERRLLASSSQNGPLASSGTWRIVRNFALDPRTVSRPWVKRSSVSRLNNGGKTDSYIARELLYVSNYPNFTHIVAYSKLLASLKRARIEISEAVGNGF